MSHTLHDRKPDLGLPAGRRGTVQRVETDEGGIISGSKPKSGAEAISG